MSTHVALLPKIADCRLPIADCRLPIADYTPKYNSKQNSCPAFFEQFSQTHKYKENKSKILTRRTQSRRGRGEEEEVYFSSFPLRPPRLRELRVKNSGINF